MARTTPPRRLSPWLPLLMLAGCNLENAGEPPPSGRTNFPTALSLSPTAEGERAEHLLVVSSNFDLRYNKGSLQAFDLDAVAAAIERCLQKPTDCARSTDGVIEVDPDEPGVLADEILVDSFGTAIALATPNAGGVARVYVPVRSQSYLAYLDYDPSGDALLSCGNRGRRCSGAYERGDESVVNDRDIVVPGEPVGLVAGVLSDWDPAADADVEYVMVAHRRGQVSLFVDGNDGRPALTDTLDTFPSGTAGVMFDPQSRLAYLLGDGKNLSRVGVSFTPGETQVARIYDGGDLQLQGVTTSGDTRAGLVMPGTDDRASQAILVGRVPAAYMEADLGPASRFGASTAVTRTVEVGSGPSRVATGTLLGEDGVSIELVAVSCFDGRQVFLIDRDSGQTLSVVSGFSGPFELAIDGHRRLLYVADFRSSVVRVVDLAPLLNVDMGVLDAPTSAKVVATIGHPRVVQELK